MDPITPLSVYRDHYKPGDPESHSWCKNHTYTPIRLGWIYSAQMKGHSINNVKGPSYNRITNETTLEYDEKGSPKTIATIKDYSVYLNDVLIATSPAGKNKAQKEKFCKAIVWALMNDPISLQDKLSEISEIKPAIIQEDLSIDIVPDQDTIRDMTITNEEITGYPVIDLIEQMSDEENILLSNGMFSSGLSMQESIEKGFDNFEDDHFSDILHTENLKEILPEILPEITRSVFSVISTRFIPWLNLTITEEVYA